MNTERIKDTTFYAFKHRGIMRHGELWTVCGGKAFNPDYSIVYTRRATTCPECQKIS